MPANITQATTKKLNLYVLGLLYSKYGWKLKNSSASVLSQNKFYENKYWKKRFHRSI